MARTDEFRRILAGMPVDQRSIYLDANSGLPGPRANLELLHAAAAEAVRLCSVVTDHLVARPAEQRRDPHVRTLRQALGFCWSVAVAADPGPGLPPFLALASSTDPDVIWIVRENRRKNRLKRLLPEQGAS